MKYIVYILSLSLLLVSCGKMEPLSQTGKNDSIVQKQEKQGTTVVEWDTVSVDYIGKFEDGTVFDSSLKEEAKKSKNFSEGRTYEPLVLTVKDGGGTISGFWKAIVGMKVGERKTVKLSPEEAYGWAWINNGESVVDKKIFDSVLTRTIPKSETQDTIKMVVETSVIAGNGPLPKVGDILTNDRGVKAKVESVNEKNVELSIDNSTSPFRGKKIAKGTTITFEDGNVGTITAVDDVNVTLKVKNNSNPFAGKKLAVGLTGMYRNTQKVTITKIEGDNVTLSIQTKNTHPLADKTLNFEIELKEIQSISK
jgi:FKBP-type peptidyl-prolyl cis-trans isomerase 2